MGGGASTNSGVSNLSGEQKSALMKEMKSKYEESLGGDTTDVELFTTLRDTFETKLTTLPASPGANDESKVDSSVGMDNEIIPVVSIDSLTGGEMVDDDEEEDESDDEHGGRYETKVDASSSLLTKTSQALLSELVDEEEGKNAEINEFLNKVKEGNLKTHVRGSQFRQRRLTFDQHDKAAKAESPSKPRNKRTTIFASTEIGLKQEKQAPFPPTVMGTYSCHGIEPGRIYYYEDEEEEVPMQEEAVKDKINQDRGCVVYPYRQSQQEALFVVLDGHGEQGDKVSDFTMKQVVVSLEKHADLETDPVEALKDTFTRTNMALMVTNINYMTSGTTCVCVYMRGKKLYVANCGDSRAVMAVKDPDDASKFTAKDLSRDHKPDDPEEMARIKEWGGFVKMPPEPGLSGRVYLDEKLTMIGLAMARSIGDFAVKAVGVIPEPEVKIFDLEINDSFMIMASDGVWEFISSQEAIDIVQTQFDEGADCNSACQILIEQASERWAEEEGDYRDDITAIVVKFPLAFQSFETSES